MNPFWPAAAAGSASIYGAKQCNLNVVPSAELHGNIPGRAANSSQDKGHGHAMFPGYLGKEKGSQAAANMDNAQRKQILLQQALPPGASSNILVLFVFFLTLLADDLLSIFLYGQLIPFSQIPACPCFHLPAEPAAGSSCCICSTWICEGSTCYRQWGIIMYI